MPFTDRGLEDYKRKRGTFEFKNSDISPQDNGVAPKVNLQFLHTSALTSVVMSCSYK